LDRPQYAYSEARGQYDSKGILEHLVRAGPAEGVRLLGVTQVDLFVPILKFVFGLAQVGGTGAVVSTHRLRPEFYEEPSDGERLLQRVEKTAVHELGHTLGLIHCRRPLCVMHSSTDVESTDQKGPDYCPTCRELLQWHLERCRP
jgi:archaemetzincin